MDDVKQYIWIRFIKAKDEVVIGIIQFVNFCYRQGYPVMALQHNDGGEYINERLSNFLEEMGIVSRVTAVYSHESNVVAVQLSSTITIKVRSLIHHHPLTPWVETYKTAVFIKN